ncbi:hypothetical protein QCN29_13250 [Streptomyces sp. HNM0663]|uniref:Uncharacterized protein n=1 Tax=Streptomyces chengmaiensis TaxID=3040919 RepID=A0ABT6HLY2_9ACTN|nr:hypothetical protein [Streptomyces chengmaiensis]MDH2389744.1 hypothetical protein [Streptomyces chengmaiensis]
MTRMENSMVPRRVLCIELAPRDLPTAITSSAGAALAFWANAPWEIVIPVALLIVLDIRVRHRLRRT